MKTRDKVSPSSRLHLSGIPFHSIPFKGVLTHDGRILNQSGHMLIALCLLQEMGLESVPLLADEERNVVLRDQRRASRWKEEALRRMDSASLNMNMDGPARGLEAGFAGRVTIEGATVS